jgi:hypothetical protein
MRSVRIALLESPKTILQASPLHTGSQTIFIAQKIAEILVSNIGKKRTIPASIRAFFISSPSFFLIFI